MDHITLDRAWSDDRNFNNQIVKAPWAKAREHRHLRAAFDLENADSVRIRNHVVNDGVFGGDIVKFEARRHGGTKARSEGRGIQRLVVGLCARGLESLFWRLRIRPCNTRSVSASKSVNCWLGESMVRPIDISICVDSSAI